MGDQPGTRERLGGLLGSLGDALGDQPGAWERLGAPPGKPWDALRTNRGLGNASGNLLESLGDALGGLGDALGALLQIPRENILERPLRIHVRCEGP